jgi:hypothetical protein
MHKDIYNRRYFVTSEPCTLYCIKRSIYTRHIAVPSLGSDIFFNASNDLPVFGVNKPYGYEASWW